MRRFHLNFNLDWLQKALYGLLTAAGLTLLLLLVGRNVLGEGAIALLYLLPVTWSVYRWGQGAGIAAAVTGALTFDYFFIPPFYTFVIGRLEGWLILAFFLVVSIVIVGRIQASLLKAQTSAREAVFMYELSAMLAGAHTRTAVAHQVARFIQQRYLTALVTVALEPQKSSEKIIAAEPRDGVRRNTPDLTLPILNGWGLVGEIQLWRGHVALPAGDSPLLQNFTLQVGQALERVQLLEAIAAGKREMV
jgi:K+-sensing histidine kinase KdpD